MLKVLVALGLVFLGGGEVFAYSSGQLSCQFEIVSKSNPSQYYRPAAFEFNVMDVYENSFEYAVLKSPIRFRYTPGITGKNDVKVFVIDMTYMMANAGADVPAMADASYTVKIGRQDSDLIGAFLTCAAKGLK